ncbi:MAG TPA: hypothetical protein VFR99_09505 [Marmoricola sp.]|nr:hypothetical protein [Marmoricola sp.]
MSAATPPPEGLPPLWVAIGAVLLVGAALAVVIEAGTARQRRHLDALWAAARRHQLREHEELMTALIERARPVTPPATRRTDDAITVELEVVKLNDTNGETK